MIHIRRAGTLDARPMAELLNSIIEKGGTTAYTETVSPDVMVEKMSRSQPRAVWHVAEDDTGAILGFQFFKPHPDLPEDACDIATFVQIGQTGLGIGSKLFEASREAARTMGFAWINATIRGDNAGGLAYYQSRGFEDYARLSDQRLANGSIVDKICKRIDL